MELQNNFFLRSPGGENEGGSNPANENKDVEQSVIERSGEAKQKGKSFFSKIREALKDWSNQDQADQQFDDTRV